MPTALQLRLRASCLRWRPHEVQQVRTASRVQNPKPWFLRSKDGQSSIKLKKNEPLRPNKATSIVQKQPKAAKAVQEWPAAPIRSERKKSSRLNDATPLTQEQPKAQRPSLLEELFPEEAQKKSARATPQRERDIPRLDVRSTIPKPPIQEQERESWWEPEDSASSNWWNSEKKSNGPKSEPGSESTPGPPAEETKQQVMGVLMLRNASKTLVEEDFTRLIPQGLHIEGWPLDQADIIKVVPGRDTSTLERQNWYLILFNSRKSMNAYRTHVQHLHVLASRHMQSSLTSPIPPPPGYLVQGQNVDAMVQGYALIPPSRALQLLPLPDEISPSLSAVVRNQGYPDLVQGSLKHPHIVKLHLEGPQISLNVIRRMMTDIEKERRIPWDNEFAKLCYSIWVPKGRNISPLDSRGRLDKVEHVKTSRDQEAEPEIGDEAKRARRKPKASYLVGFHNEDKAQTFVRYWHRKPVELDNYTYEDDEIAPVIEAELLW